MSYSRADIERCIEIIEGIVGREDIFKRWLCLEEEISLLEYMEELVGIEGLGEVLIEVWERMGGDREEQRIVI